MMTTTSQNVLKENAKNLEAISEFDRCLRCHRKLKTPENRLRGMGKICWEKSHLEQSKRLF